MWPLGRSYKAVSESLRGADTGYAIQWIFPPIKPESLAAQGLGRRDVNLVDSFGFCHFFKTRLSRRFKRFQPSGLKTLNSFTQAD